MLENPYAPAQPQIGPPDDAFQGEGRLEESPDGSRFSIWGESSLDDAVDANLYYLELIGSLKLAQRSRRAIIILASFFLLLSLLPLICLFLLPVTLGLKLSLIFCCSCTALFYAIAWSMKGNVSRALRRTLTLVRGTEGTIDLKIIVDPTGIHAIILNQETIIYWEGIKSIDVSTLAITFSGYPSGLIQAPIRFFPDAAALDRFVTLARKYWEPVKSAAEH